MNEFNEEYLGKLELQYTPHTKALLIKYVKCQYEINADLSDESLKRELVLLHKDNNLLALFTGEYLLSDARLEDEAGSYM